jgi:hypothetical protein
MSETTFTPHVMIATPAYGGMVHTDYVRSLQDFTRSGMSYSLMTIGNESLITRARNSLLAAFYARPECSHLLFLDGDVFLSADGLKQLLMAHQPVIGAPVALKGKNPNGSRIWNVGRAMGSVGHLHLTEHIGTAVLMLNREAVTALVNDAIADGRTYARPRTAMGDMDAPVHYDIFRTGVVDGVYLSEDYWVCHRLRNLGFQITVDVSVVTQHHGTVAV